MRPKYPEVGELYESLLYPEQQCRVLSVVHAQVTFEWLGSFSHVARQVAPVNRFVRDFVPADSFTSTDAPVGARR